MAENEEEIDDCRLEFSLQTPSLNRTYCQQKPLTKTFKSMSLLYTRRKFFLSIQIFFWGRWPCLHHVPKRKRDSKKRLSLSLFSSLFFLPSSQMSEGNFHNGQARHARPPRNGQALHSSFTRAAFKAVCFFNGR